MNNGRLCQRDRCGDTDTEPRDFIGVDGVIYTILLCSKHRSDFKGVKPPPKHERDPKAILRIRECMVDFHRVFGMTFTRHLTIDDKPYDTITWRQFKARNRRLKKKGDWYFADYYVEKLKMGVYLFNHYLKNVEVMMPRTPLPLIVKVEDLEGEGENDFCLMIAPNVPNEGLWRLYVKGEREGKENQ